jgi:hypothetical protein
MFFCGTPEGGGTCMFRGSLQSAADGLRFFEEESGGGGGGGGGGLHTTSLILNSDPGTDTGSGSISSSEGEFNFAFNSAQFCRDDGTTESCFDRDADVGEYSTWRYGTYNANGTRLEVTNPGFPVKFEYDEATGPNAGHKVFYGFWSFWGLWLPDTALANLANGTLTRRVGEADVPLTTEKHGGKLWKLTRTVATLDDLKNVSMMFWSQQTVGSLPAGNYEVKWNGSSLQAVSKHVCDGDGCHPQPLQPNVEIDADDLRTANQRALPVFFQAGGGNGMVNVPDAGAFVGSTDVFYRTRDMVKPDAPDLNLDCVNQCLLSGSALETALGNAQSPYTGSWGPASVVQAYTFSGGDLSHDGHGGALVDASGIDGDDMGANYRQGLNSGAMIEHANLSEVRCDMDGTPNTVGAYYCPSQVEKAEVIYQWETGPNQWNQYFGAIGVTIDPPKMLNLAAHYTSPSDSANTIFGGAAGDYHGNNLQLQFSGFGELQGVPGNCVSPETNASAPCTQHTRWVPAFNLKDGAGVSDGSATYFVRYLERELRLTTVARDGGSPTVPTNGSLTLPTSDLISVNAMTQIGSIPNEADVPSKPAVIDGTVQATD